MYLSEKTIIRWRKEDIELHKKVIKTYLHSKNTKSSTQKKFFKLYDKYITPKNILWWFHLPVNLFVQALVLDKLEQYQTYIIREAKKEAKCTAKKSKR